MAFVTKITIGLVILLIILIILISIGLIPMSEQWAVNGVFFMLAMNYALYVYTDDTESIST